MYSFLSKALTHIAIRFPQHAPRVIEMLKNNRKDREQTIAYIGAIGKNVPATGAAALEFLKDKPGEEAMHRISQIGLTNEELSQQAFDILSAQTGYVPIKHLTDYALVKPNFTLKVLDVLKNHKGDYVTREIGHIGLSSDVDTASAVFNVLKCRPGLVSASEMAQIAVEFHALAPDIMAEIISRTELDNSLNIGYIGRAVEGMAFPALEELRLNNSVYADMQIEEIGLKVESARAEAIRILIERESYDRARQVTMMSNGLKPDQVLSKVIIIRDFAVAHQGAEPKTLDEKYTRPLIKKVMPYDAYFSRKEGEIGDLYHRATKIITSAGKPTNDNPERDIKNYSAPAFQ